MYTKRNKLIVKTWLATLVGVLVYVTLGIVKADAAPPVVRIDYCTSPPSASTYENKPPTNNKCPASWYSGYICPLNPNLVNCHAQDKDDQQKHLPGGVRMLWCIPTDPLKDIVGASIPYSPPLDTPKDGSKSPSCPSGHWFSSNDVCWSTDGKNYLTPANSDGKCPGGYSSTVPKNVDPNKGVPPGGGNTVIPPISTGNVCGGGLVDPSNPLGAQYDSINTAINIGCKGKGSAIVDLFLAIVRFLSVGVGVVVVASIVVAGIQYTVSRGDPQATAKALKRITFTGAALLLYIFAFALLNFLVPGGLF